MSAIHEKPNVQVNGTVIIGTESKIPAAEALQIAFNAGQENVKTQIYAAHLLEKARAGNKSGARGI